MHNLMYCCRTECVPYTKKLRLPAGALIQTLKKKKTSVYRKLYMIYLC